MNFDSPNQNNLNDFNNKNMADFANYNCGCPTNNIGCGYNQVINKCFVSDVPHYVNYNTHVVNNCIKRHYIVPTYSTTEETKYFDEYQTMPYQTNNPYQAPQMNYPFQGQINNPFGF